MNEKQKKRYAFVGLGSRSGVFVRALATTHRDDGDIVALCDISALRTDECNRRLREEHDYPAVPTYHADDFEKMIREQNVDVVIVTTMDSLHHVYIIRAMEAGCDVIVEKPMTTDAEKARAIQDVINRTGRQLQVTFNVRYQPVSTKARELIMQGVIGKPLAVSLTYQLDTRHGASYFRRWHRDKSQSGGLLVHKATHQFDLVNWLVDSQPEEVFAMGAVNFYGRGAAQARNADTERYPGEGAADDPLAVAQDKGRHSHPHDQDAQTMSSYLRDRDVFAEDITSEDTATVVTRYKNGVIFNYSLVAYAPQEGYDLYVTGTRGRIEIVRRRPPHVIAEQDENEDIADPAEEGKLGTTLRVFPMFGKPYEVEVPHVEGGHGGGDALMTEHLFSTGPESPDPFGRRASFRDGLLSLAIGAAANQSIATHQPVQVAQMLAIDGLPA